MGFNENDAWGTAWAEWCIKWLKKYKCCWRCRSGADGGSAFVRYAGQVQCNAKIEFDTVTTNTEAWHALYDIDAVVTLDCTGCPLLSTLDDGMHAKVTQYHEFKANKQTHEGYRTQNLAIEVIENDTIYDANNPVYGTLSEKEKKFKPGVWQKNPIHIRGQVFEEQVIGGAGWWIKRDKVKRKDKDGNETIIEDDPLKHATWYHFIQMFGGSVMNVSEELEKAFLEDDNISPDSALLRYYPFPYVVSVEGCYLENLIKKNRYNEHSYMGKKQTWDGKEIKRYGYLIPVGDIVPANAFVYKLKTKEYSFVRKSGKNYSNEHVKVTILSDRERPDLRKHERDHQIDTYIRKNPCHSPSRVYVPKEFIDRLFMCLPSTDKIKTSTEERITNYYETKRQIWNESRWGKDSPIEKEKVDRKVEQIVKQLGLDSAQMMILKPDWMKRSFMSNKRGQIELLDFMVDLIVNRWWNVYPPDEQE